MPGERLVGFCCALEHEMESLSRMLRPVASTFPGGKETKTQCKALTEPLGPLGDEPVALPLRPRPSSLASLSATEEQKREGVGSREAHPDPDVVNESPRLAWPLLVWLEIPRLLSIVRVTAGAGVHRVACHHDQVGEVWERVGGTRSVHQGDGDRGGGGDPGGDGVEGPDEDKGEGEEEEGNEAERRERGQLAAH